MKNILVFVNSFDYGGVTEVVKNIYRNLNRQKYSMDFVSMRCLNSDFEKEIIDKGDNIYYLSLPPLNRIPFLNYNFRNIEILKQVKKLIGKNRYDTAHIHAHADIYTKVARYLKINRIIIHAHEAVTEFYGNENVSRITNYILQKRRKLYFKSAACLAGDSRNACIAKYGKSVENDSRMKILYPPINTDRFNAGLYTEEEAVTKFGIDKSAINIIHVGRLSPVKNQKFIMDILKNLLKLKKSHFYLVGEGELREELEEYAKKIGVYENVSFLQGNTSPLIYKGMDCSVLPSISEAFGMVAVESQMMGVPCFLSTNIPRDVDIGMCEFIDLKQGAEFWADEILEYFENGSKVKNKTVVNKFTVEELMHSIDELYSL